MWFLKSRCRSATPQRHQKVQKYLTNIKIAEITEKCKMALTHYPKQRKSMCLDPFYLWKIFNIWCFKFTEFFTWIKICPIFFSFMRSISLLNYVWFWKSYMIDYIHWSRFLRRLFVCLLKVTPLSFIKGNFLYAAKSQVFL